MKRAPWWKRFTPEARAAREMSLWPVAPPPLPPPRKPPRRSSDSGRSATPPRHPVQISVGEHLDAIRPVLAGYNAHGRRVSEEEITRAWAAFDELRRLFG